MRQRLDRFSQWRCACEDRPVFCEVIDGSMNEFVMDVSRVLKGCRWAGVVVAGVLWVTLAGCMDITGRGAAPLAKTMVPETETPYPRAGYVYCMRGWLGIFSTGMDDLSVKIEREVKSVAVADEEWRRLKGFLIKEHRKGHLTEPLVLVGHSWGADDQIRVCEQLAAEGITVDLLITVDPVTPPVVPANVKRCFNIYKSHPVTDGMPVWRGVEIDPKSTKVPVTNINLRDANLGFDTDLIDHINIEKNAGVHELVIAEIRKVCPLRNSGSAAAVMSAVGGPEANRGGGTIGTAAVVVPARVGTP